MVGGEFRGHQPRAPRERHAGAAVTVVVDNQLVVQLVRFQDEAGIAMRTQADRGPDDAVPGRVDRLKMEGRFTRRGGDPLRSRRAGTHAKSDRSDTSGGEKGTSM